jgi:hypothetical protein
VEDFRKYTYQSLNEMASFLNTCISLTSESGQHSPLRTKEYLYRRKIEVEKLYLMAKVQGMFGLTECDAEWSGRKLPPSRRKILPPSMLWMEAAGFSEILVTLSSYLKTKRNLKAEDSNIDNHHRESLKPNTGLMIQSGFQTKPKQFISDLIRNFIVLVA